MHGEGAFFQAFVYLTAAVISVPIAKRLGFGSVLGYLIAGTAIGPFALGLTGGEGQDVMHFAEFGVVMMLFLVGLELKPELLWRLRGAIVGLGGLQVAMTTAAITAISLAIGLVWQSALAIGMILALSSTAFVLQTLAEKGLMKTDAGQSSFAVLLFQDIAVIPMLALFPLLSLRSSAEPGAAASSAWPWVEELPAWAYAAAVLATVMGLILAGRYLFRPLFRFISVAAVREIFTAAALMMVIGIALLMTKVGLSPALGTFLAGVVLAESEFRYELESDIEPFKGLLLGLFFIAVGSSIDFALVAAEPVLVLGLVGALVAIKVLVLVVLGRLFRMSIDQNLLFAFALAQGGEFGFVLFSFATQQGVLSPEQASPLIVVVALSMGLTPLMLLVNEKLIQPRVGTLERERREPELIDDQNPVILAGFGRFGSVIGRFLKANGVHPTVLDLDSDAVEVLRMQGIRVFYGDASRADLLRAAGADQAQVLILAIDDTEKLVEMVATAQKHFPQLTILARAANREVAYELLDRGVEQVYRETLDSSLRVGSDALRALGFRGHQVVRAARTFRRHDERALRELAGMRHDRKAYRSRARERIKDLEDMLGADFTEVDRELDAAWDASSRRAEFGRQPDEPTDPSR